ncbi:MAG: NAD-binding protein, partial [Planctomycetes bacterium]|nr:NAD-binding protein [Planctomycetota bacterium]
FIMASPLNRFGKLIYSRWHDTLIRKEMPTRLPGDEVIDTSGAKILVFGMGRVGTAAYDFLVQRIEEGVIGIERNDQLVQEHCSKGRRIIVGDATDMDFWQRKQTSDQLRLVLLTFPDHQSNRFVAKTIREMGISAHLASIATYDDQVDSLQKAGIDRVYNFYSEAGVGFAEHVWEAIGCNSGNLECPFEFKKNS